MWRCSGPPAAPHSCTKRLSVRVSIRTDWWTYRWTASNVVEAPFLTPIVAVIPWFSAAVTVLAWRSLTPPQWSLSLEWIGWWEKDKDLGATPQHTIQHNTNSLSCQLRLLGCWPPTLPTKLITIAAAAVSETKASLWWGGGMEGTNKKKKQKQKNKKSRRVVSQNWLLTEHLHYVESHVSLPNLKKPTRTDAHTDDAS